MSYLGQRMKRRVRRSGLSGLAGLSSRPYGPNVSMRAIGDIVEYGSVAGTATLPASAVKPKALARTKMHGYPTTVHGPAMQGPPDWYRAMQGASLGDDTPTTGAATLTDGTTQWQQSMLSTTQDIANAQWAMAEKDRWIRYLQIAATLSIPLAAAVWKMIFRGGSSSM